MQDPIFEQSARSAAATWSRRSQSEPGDAYRRSRQTPVGGGQNEPGEMGSAGSVAEGHDYAELAAINRTSNGALRANVFRYRREIA